MRRDVAAAFALHEQKLRPVSDVLVIARAHAPLLGLADVDRELGQVLQLND